MVVRRHVVYVSRKGIGYAVIQHVHHEIEILSADGIGDDALCLAGTKTWNLRPDNVVVTEISGKRDVILVLVAAFLAPLDQVVVDFRAKFLATGYRNQPQGTYRDVL
jgi:hypothetical protein